jgi:predicted enzyme related to lactoylglutathione lyase
MKKMNPVVHFELPAKDRNRMAEFYSGVFGWEAKMLGEDMGNYVTVATVESDENGRPRTPGAINGGLFPIKEGEKNRYPSLVIGVDDILDAMKKVTKAGGKVEGEPMLIPGVGKFVAFIDTEGNTMSLLQPLMM